MKNNYYLIFIAFVYLHLGAQEPVRYDTIKSNELEWREQASKMNLSAAEREEYIRFRRSLTFFKAVKASGEDVHSESVADASPKPAAGGKGLGNGGTVQALTCNNVDFELGSTSGWTLTNGYHPNSTITPACCPSAGAVNAITSGAGTDPFGGFPVVYPGGGAFSLRLGDSNTGAHADR